MRATTFSLLGGLGLLTLASAPATAASPLGASGDEQAGYAESAMRLAQAQNPMSPGGGGPGGGAPSGGGGAQSGGGGAPSGGGGGGAMGGGRGGAMGGGGGGGSPAAVRSGGAPRGGGGGGAVSGPMDGGGRGGIRSGRDVGNGRAGMRVRGDRTFRGDADVNVRTRTGVRDGWRGGDRWRYRHGRRFYPAYGTGVYVGAGGWCHRHHWRWRVMRHCHPYRYRWHRHGPWR